MDIHRIFNRFTSEIIFAGAFPNLRACVEQAVRDRVCLDDAALPGARLVNAALDEASLRRADLSGANLMGANLTESRLDGADFADAGLQNACLCFSSVKNCNFSGALFGATDIAGSVVDGSVFTTQSALTLNFTDAKSLKNCRYRDSRFSRPPVVIAGLDCPVALFDDRLHVGALTLALPGLTPDSSHRSSPARAFWRRHEQALRPALRAFRPEITPVSAQNFVDII